MRGFLAALTMITALPVPGFHTSEKDLKSSANYFPFVGLLTGALTYGLGYLAETFLPGLIAAAFLTIFPEILTKAFHLDGLADTADGFLSGRSRERKLEIMRDSHIGSMGVFAIAALLLIRFSVFASLPSGRLAEVCAFSSLAGRCALPIYLACSRYARPEGLGKILFERKPYAGIIYGLLFSFLCAGFLFDNLYLPIPFLVFVLAWKGICDRVIGGATGDTSGACEELSEGIAALTVAIGLSIAR